MYIKKVHIENFRKFDNIDFYFQKGVNLIIGENNSGKTTLIDALRLVLCLGQYKKDLYITSDDFHINKCGETAKEIKIDLYFEDLSEEQQKAFFQACDGNDMSKAELHFRYNLYENLKKQEKVKESFSAGRNEVNIDKDVFENINLVYMAALRNAESDLKPSRFSQLANLFNNNISEDNKNNILDDFEKVNDKIKKNKEFTNIKTIINNNLKLIEKDKLNQEINIDLLPTTFNGTLSSLNVFFKKDYNLLKISSEDFKSICNNNNITEQDNIFWYNDNNSVFVNLINLESYHNSPNCNEDFYNEINDKRTCTNMSLKQNGLGYNNILSMAISLGDMQNNNEEYSTLLVEEPEAHLHPQLLDLLFNFFETSNDNSQIFLTTHSPTLISKADIKRLNILHDVSGKSYSSALANINFEKGEDNDLKRYLDVTKSQLFFAKNVIFVEGITEAILLNEFAKYLKKPLDKYSVEIVNINGVAFNPFIKLFSDENGLKYPCAVISDDDRCTNDNDINKITKEDLKKDHLDLDLDSINKRLEEGDISSRAANLKESDGKGKIKIYLASKTLEYELALLPKNNNIILEVLKKLHPINATKIENEIVTCEQSHTAIKIWREIIDCKGIFAQRLAQLISEGKHDIEVPNYIKEAINHVTG